MASWVTPSAGPGAGLARSDLGARRSAVTSKTRLVPTQQPQQSHRGAAYTAKMPSCVALADVLVQQFAHPHRWHRFTRAREDLLGQRAVLASLLTVAPELYDRTGHDQWRLQGLCQANGWRIMATAVVLGEIVTAMGTIQGQSTCRECPQHLRGRRRRWPHSMAISSAWLV